jgi:cysteine desulfurase/selenocysteine lyase
MYERARATCQLFLNAASVSEIIFTKGTTESINLVASSLSELLLKPGDVILISEIEHHANIVPWQLAAKKTKAKIKVIPVKDNGELDQAVYQQILKDEPVKIVAVNHIANSLGTINPVKEMIAAAHQAGAKILIDGAQSAPHMPVNVQDLDADFYVFSGHKVYGPTGIGVLYGKLDLLNAMPPYQGGGEMIDKVTFEETTYAEAPAKFEPGTPPIAEVIGLSSALHYINTIGLDKILAYENQLHKYMEAKASEIPELKIIGNAEHKTSIMSFTVDDLDPLDIITILNEHGIALRVGHHCAQPTMQRFNVTSTARASVSFYNTTAEVDKFIEALKSTIQMFK